MVTLSHVVSTVIKNDLEDVFGTALAGRILMSARAQADAPIIGITLDAYHRLIDAICSDDRVVGMWGSAGVEERRRRWREAATKALETQQV